MPRLIAGLLVDIAGAAGIVAALHLLLRVFAPKYLRDEIPTAEGQRFDLILKYPDGRRLKYVLVPSTFGGGSHELSVSPIDIEGAPAQQAALEAQTFMFAWLANAGRSLQSSEPSKRSLGSLLAPSGAGEQIATPVPSGSHVPLVN